MITARLYKPDGGLCIMLVLEPGNLEKIKQGQPIHKFLNEFMPELQTQVELLFVYTPDAEWVAKRAAGIHDAIELVQIIEESMSRTPVINRDYTAEERKKVF